MTVRRDLRRAKRRKTRKVRRTRRADMPGKDASSRLTSDTAGRDKDSRGGGRGIEKLDTELIRLRGKGCRACKRRAGRFGKVLRGEPEEGGRQQ